VQHARLVDPGELFPDGHIGADWYYELIVDAIQIYARATSLFDYARGGSESAPGNLDQADVLSAFRLCGFDADDWEHLHTKVQGHWN
jgi:hypothetical protein